MVHVIAWDGEVPLGRGMILFPEHDEYSTSATREGCAEVRDVFVLPERRRSGVATAIMQVAGLVLVLALVIARIVRRAGFGKPIAILAALGQGPPLEIFGTDYPTPDGTAIRDYVHVSDLARAHVAALRYLERGGPSGAFNLGTGVGVSVRQVTECIEAISYQPVPLKEGTRREGDPVALVADASRARSVLGWRAACSDIRTIVETAWRWHADRSRMVPSGVIEASPAIGS